MCQNVATNVGGSQLKAMEALLADALRREKHLEKTTAAEIEHLTRMVSSCFNQPLASFPLLFSDPECTFQVKQREDETGYHKSLNNRKIRRLEGPDTQDDHLEDTRLVVENRHLQDQLRRYASLFLF